MTQDQVMKMLKARIDALQAEVEAMAEAHRRWEEKIEAGVAATKDAIDQLDDQDDDEEE